MKKLLHTLHSGNGEFIDPFELLHNNADTSDPTNQQMKLQKSSREFFSYIMDTLLQELITVFEVNDDDIDYKDIVKRYRHKNDANPWVHVLNQAVKDGIPADFSNDENNRFYTIQKLETRTRYLHHLIMDENDICSDVRKALLDCLNARDGEEKDRTINVCALGGGPGYDHVAIWIALLFLYNTNAIDAGQISLKTEVYDLFGEWESIVGLMDQSLSNAMDTISDDSDCSEINVDVYKGNGASLKLCDIREGLDSPVNEHLRDSLTRVDIICFSFVMHENASILRSNDKDDPLIQGVTRDLMALAKVGTLMLVTDSNNLLWPTLKATAKVYGWRYFGALERDSRISMGPKEFVVLQRVRDGIFPLDEEM